MTRRRITFDDCMLDDQMDRPACTCCDYEHDGHCVRHAPRPILDSINYPFKVIWPSVTSNTFCGEFQATIEG